MATTEGMLTAGGIAKELGISGAQVKKALETLKIKPAAKKGACNYYAADVLRRVKSAL